MSIAKISIAEMSNKFVERINKYEPFTGYSGCRVYLEGIKGGVGFKNESHYRLWHNTASDYLVRHCKARPDMQKHHRKAAINMIKLKAYIDATDKVLAEPNFKYNEELRFVTDTRKYTGKTLRELR